MHFLEVQLIDRLATDDFVKKFAFKCAELEVQNLSTLPIFVPAIKSVAKMVNLSGLVDFPFGVSSHEPKIAEILRLAKLGIKTIDMVINHSHIAQNKWSSLHDDIYNCQRVCFDRKLELRCIIEPSLFEIEKIMSTCQVLEQCVVHTIILGTGTMNIDETDNIVLSKMISKDYSLSTILTTNIYKSEQMEQFQKNEIFGLRFSSANQYRNCCGV